MSQIKTDTLDVPGARLHFEVRGGGPVLLLICGGVYDAAGFAGLADQLADDYTVVTYDRRGNSRSPLAGPPEPQQISVHAEDARRLLETVGVSKDRPASVFGNSSGASMGLDLATRHPHLVDTVVAHEPPLLGLLPDRERLLGLIDRVEAAYTEKGWADAMMMFANGLGMRRGDNSPPADAAGREIMARNHGNMPFFVGMEVPPFSRWLPDLDALRAADVRIVPGAGDDSRGEAAHEAAVELGRRLDVAAAGFPGDHGGFGMAEPFAARLREVLDAA